MQGNAQLSLISSIEQIEIMESCLMEFCCLLGQRVSLNKSHIFLSRNVNPAVAPAMSQHCGIPLMTSRGKYLGVPLLQERVKKSTFSPVIDRVKARLTGWKANFLSIAGRATLIKAVTNAILPSDGYKSPTLSNL